MKKQKKIHYKIITLLSSLIILLSQTTSLFISNQRQDWEMAKTTLKREWNQPELTKKQTFRIRPLGNKIDLKKRYFPNRAWVKERGYNGLWIKNNGKKWGNYEYNLTNAFLSRSRYFSLPFYEIKYFRSYKKLLSFLNYDLRTSWEYIVNNICKSYKNRLKKLIVLFYNFIVNIMPIKNINAFVRRIDVNSVQDGWGISYASSRYIKLKKSTLSCEYVDITNYEWRNGISTSSSVFQTLFHELGHIINFYYDYKRINLIMHLKTFLTQKIDNRQDLDQEKVFQLFHLSNLSYQDEDEFFAESFSYLFLANRRLKTKAWELWYEFHTWYLPKVLRAKKE